MTYNREDAGLWVVNGTLKSVTHELDGRRSGSVARELAQLISMAEDGVRRAGAMNVGLDESFDGLTDAPETEIAA
jgi:hypothetical protein